MNQQKNQNYWQNIAQEYNRNIGDKGDVRHEKIINPIVFKLLGDLSGKVVLDAGCGNGYLSRRMAKTAKKVIGIDFTKKLIEAAKQEINPQNVEFIEGNLEHLPFQSDSFDTVLCNMVLMDVERIDKVIGELGRVLKQNGVIIASTLHPCFENPPRTYSLFDDKGKRIGRLIQKYFDTGLIKDKNNKINDEQYQHYHYMISDHLNVFAVHSLYLEKMIEPNGYEIDKNKNMGMNPDTPTFMIMKYRVYRR